MKKKLRRAALGAGFVLAALAVASLVYLADFYRADADAAACLAGGGAVAVTRIDTGLFLDGPGTEAALVFYPGAKVEYTAYAPLLFSLAEDGVDCFCVKMPGNLALLGGNRVEALRAAYPYARWYLAGHSLGGVAAANWAAAHPGALAGLVLLAAYPTKQLPADLPVLELYGSADGVMNRERRAAGDRYLPARAVVLELEGGNHAQFGNYGPQKGDGQAECSRAEQQAWTASAIRDWMARR